MEETELEFVVRDKSNVSDGKIPRWVKAKAKNDRCPKGHQMVVITGDVLYAWCGRCRSYYLAK